MAIGKTIKKTLPYELYALDYQFDTTTPQRYYFGQLGNEAVVLLMEAPYSRQALDQMAAQLGSA